MRILVAASEWFPDVEGGTARVAAETAAALVRRGHELTVLVPRRTRDARDSVENGVAVRRRLPRTAVPQTLGDVPATWRYARRERASGYDVLLGHGATTVTGLALAAGAAPVVQVFHASEPRELRFMRSRSESARDRAVSRLLEPPLVLFEHTSLARASRVVVLSEFTRSLLAADHPDRLERVRLVSGGVDVASFAPDGGVAAARARLGLPLERDLLVTVRRLEPRMGIEQLLDALRLLSARRNLSLAIVGGGMLDASLRRLAQTLGVGDRVRFVGRAPEGELRDWYRAADLFVLPTTAYEGFGMVTAEALASGTPVVGTPVGATPELLEPLDPRLVARGTDGAALAGAIDEALSFVDAGFRGRCREYACSRFAWERAIVAWEQALEEAASAPRRRAGPG